MSQRPSDSPSEKSPEANRPARGFSDEELAAQARAAADQALQLARLAEESARLARHLNEQVAARAGHSFAVPTETASQANRITLTAPATSGTSPQAADRRDSFIDMNQQPVPEQAGVVNHGPVHIKTTLPRRQAKAHPVQTVRRSWNSVLLSALLHGSVLVVLGLLTFVVRSDDPINTILASFADDEAPVEEALPVEEPIEEIGEQQEQPSPEPMDAPPEEPQPEQEQPVEEPAVEELPPAMPEEMKPDEPTELAEASDQPPTPESEPAAAPAVDLSQVGSRSEAGKAVLLEKYGGTAASESAVSRTLEWFVSVQRSDGSWNFNDVGQASHAGTVNNPMGATSYVLLSFLGAGQTHRQGKFKKNVGAGLNFLLKYGRPVPAGADLRGPNIEDHHNFYVQGAAAMALSEAFAMTKDRRLKGPAQGAIDFIIAAQDPRGGGWRYEPFEAGCTSVTTLQLTALISAKNAGLKVPPNVLDGVRHYYTTVQCDGSPTGRYCYRAEKPQYNAASTAQATLGRMYLGAARDDEDLRAAVALLHERGPYDNRYYCYYATQVLKNWGGDEWNRWNQSLREELIRTQIAEDGPAIGSWTPLQRAETDVAGGRLFATALSALTLEVYYRYLPIYDAFEPNETDPAAAGEVASDDDVPPPMNKP